eukprot:gene12856-16372_t
MRAAQLLFALFQGQGVPSWDRFTDVLWHSARSLPFLAAGVAIGAALAALAFVIGAFSIPLLLDRRHSNVFEAIATSVAVVRLNPRPMLLWAGLIVLLVAMAMVPGLLGLVVVLPVVAHATWHAYRDVVVFEPAPPSVESRNFLPAGQVVSMLADLADVRPGRERGHEQIFEANDSAGVRPGRERNRSVAV